MSQLGAFATITSSRFSRKDASSRADGAPLSRAGATIPNQSGQRSGPSDVDECTPTLKESNEYVLVTFAL